jgi:ELWxxDGT repeat protein
LLFRVDDGNGGFELWSTNGTTATPLAASGDFSDVGIVGAHYYYAVPRSTETELWRTDGDSTKRLAGLPGSPFATYEVAEVAGDPTSLYVRIVHSSSTVEETAVRVVKYDLDTEAAADLVVYAGSVEDANEPGLFSAVRGSLYFDARSGVGRELWSSDGTPAGTRLLRNIAPETGNASSAPGAFVAYADRLYFAADDGIYGRELWSSDASSAGTTLVLDLHPGPGSSEPQDAFVVGSRLLFFARDGVGHESYRLWATDGTTTGSQSLTPALMPPTLALLEQFPPPTWASPPRCGPWAVNVGAHAYFRAYGIGSGWQLWRTDGTPGGTARVGPYFPSAPCWLTVFDGRIYFGADGGNGSGIELWRYDPATLPLGAASLVADLWPGSQGSNPAELTALDGRVLFHAYSAANVEQLWQSDGTSAGTLALTSFAASSSIRGITRANSRVVFGLGPAEELWASDGTAAGTARVGTVTFGWFGGTLGLSSRVLFQSIGPSTRFDDAPWVTDGTPDGTYLLHDDLETGDHFESFGFVDFNGLGVFNGSEANDRRLWRSDGTRAGTTLIGGSGFVGLAAAPPPTRLAAGQSFFYISNEGGVGTELFAFGNDAPLASNDAVAAETAAAVTIAVLANDRDLDGALDASSVRVTSAPASGTAVADASGAIIYTSSPGFTGADSFSYTVADTQRAMSLPATVQVVVAAPPPNPPPPDPAPPDPQPPNPPPTPTPTPPASGGGGGGGGGMGCGAALLLLAALRLRRSRRHGRGYPPDKRA